MSDKSMIRSFRLEGVVPATLCPMDENGAVDISKLGPYSEYLADNGINQVYVNGATGEGVSLTTEERKKILEEWMRIKQRGGRIKTVVAHIGALNLPDTLDLAAHAASVGADAIATLPPLFYKPKTVSYLVTYCQQIAAAAPDLPFYYYHLPAYTGVELSMEEFLREAVTKIPSLVGVKFSAMNLVDLVGAVHVTAPHRDSNKFNILFGVDQMLLGGMVMGAAGKIGSMCNFLPQVFARMLRSFAAGNMEEARLDQYRIQQTATQVHKHGALLGGPVSSIKCVMQMLGLDFGPCRAPVRKATPAEQDRLRQDLQEIGFFDWTK